MSSRYNHREVEPKWRERWAAAGIDRALTPDEAKGKKKAYVLEMFPYPSGRIHVGHSRNYTMGDVIARFRRSNGYNVLHPMGWDAFGLPAEQHAIKTQQPPRVTTEKNIATFRRQLKSLGFSYDWDREISTTDPYYSAGRSGSSYNSSTPGTTPPLKKAGRSLNYRFRPMWRHKVIWPSTNIATNTVSPTNSKRQ